MKDGTLQKSNTGFPSETGSPYYMELPTFSALIKHIEKKIQSVRYHVSKTSSLNVWNSLGIIKDFQVVSPAQAISLCIWIPPPEVKIIFKINPLDMVFPTWVSPPLTSQIPFSRLPTAKVHFPHWITFLSNNPIRTSFFAVVIDPLPFLILTSYSFYTQVMVILVLIDVQYLQNVVF